MKKVKIAFIKYDGLTAGGTELWIQSIAAQLDKNKYIVDYFYTGQENPYRKKMLEDNEVTLIKIKASEKESAYGQWLDTDFWEKFNENEYDIIQTAKAGPQEWPYYLIKKPVIEFVALDYGVDFSDSIKYSIHPSNWQRNKWLKMGGNPYSSCVVPVPTALPHSDKNLRTELNIQQNAIVAGFHQRVDDNTYSYIPIEAFSKTQADDRYFIIMGGSKKYSKQAKDLGIKNFIQIEHCADKEYLSKFLNTLDIFAHGRKDGETFGTVFAEALIHGKPCLSHYSGISDAHKDTMGPHGLFAKNKTQYREYLEKLYSDKELRTELSKGAVDFAIDNYHVDAAVKKVEEVYNIVLEGRERAFGEKLYKIWRTFKKIKLIKKEKFKDKKVFTILGIKITLKKNQY